ncbi:MAG TPA: arsenosugar biosynthesis radical SAM (seleno)protein ArsS [Rubricoccaceae bacterium]|nr:arsenosugar biosynthesis radical SAM (seleno)protein ArsS [Rubricoccaceae bacterium]
MTPLPVLPEGPRPTTSLRARRTPLAAPAAQLAALDALPLPDGTGNFEADLATSGWAGGLTPAPLEVFQINVGRLCNMTCRHCHVDAGPDRTEENMDRATAEACVAALDRILAVPGSALHTVDLTGGAPELNPHFAYLVEESRARGLHVIDRCNLTILTTRPFSYLPQWLADRQVEVACSLPHYRALGTDAQRGEGAYARSIEALRALNAVGYGQGDPGRRLTLVTNPVGAFLPGQQGSLEAEWKRELQRLHGVTFDRLFTITNMPISRYLEWLLDKGLVQAYMERLTAAFNPAAVAGLMCRNTISVSWDGRLFDCDFNQMLDLEARAPAHPHMTVRDFDLDAWQARRVVTARHCYGCTAGAGSSCGGTTT